MSDQYFTINGPGKGLYKEKGSKFISLAFPVRNEEEIKEKLTALRQEYYDARHHCYAYVLGPERKVFRANDDGEPAHSAGTPILNQIRAQELTDVLVVVVRYFGGTKLGVPGLINAYKISAAEALSSAPREAKRILELFEVTCPYEQLSKVLRVQKETGAEVVKADYNVKCAIRLGISKNKAPLLLAQLEELRNFNILICDVGCA